MPRRLHAASMMRTLAWWGTRSFTSAAVTPAEASARSEELTITRTARRKTSLPSILVKLPWSA